MSPFILTIDRLELLAPVVVQRCCSINLVGMRAPATIQSLANGLYRELIAWQRLFRVNESCLVKVIANNDPVLAGTRF